MTACGGMSLFLEALGVEGVSVLLGASRKPWVAEHSTLHSRCQIQGPPWLLSSPQLEPGDVVISTEECQRIAHVTPSGSEIARFSQHRGRSCGSLRPSRGHPLGVAPHGSWDLPPVPRPAGAIVITAVTFRIESLRWAHPRAREHRGLGFLLSPFGGYVLLRYRALSANAGLTRRAGGFAALRLSMALQVTRPAGVRDSVGQQPNLGPQKEAENDHNLLIVVSLHVYDSAS
ncbi:hypothetical protein BDZ91DRAFT_764063 [Kalaharituber pfeilii]|nr:hypothetical protein BDZ91DRAFT_764063 [Kalaharituber pfeilii]